MGRMNEPIARARGADRLAGFGETVFATYTRLASETGAVDLGQGYPDFEPPAFVLEALSAAATGYQQYAPLPGTAEFLAELARDVGATLGRELDPTAELQVTVGATEGLFAAMQALVDPGDEVLLLEPFYDAYPADVIMAGGIPRFLPLDPLPDGRWGLDPDALRRAVTDRTRVIVVNTPHNPTGKVFTAAELDALVAAAAAVDAVLVSDEVYEHIAFTQHVPLASRPGAYERTLSISSLGKTFSVTGWKIGWVAGPPPLVRALRTAHQWIPFAVATPLQRAAASILRAAREGSYYEGLRADYRARRDLLLEALEPTPFRALVPEGGYFVMADSSALGYPDDVALCLDLPRRAGVAAIPPSAFFSAPHRHLARHLVRFAYCKGDAALREAGRRLAALA